MGSIGRKVLCALAIFSLTAIAPLNTSEVKASSPLPEYELQLVLDAASEITGTSPEDIEVWKNTSISYDYSGFSGTEFKLYDRMTNDGFEILLSHSEWSETDSDSWNSELLVHSNGTAMFSSWSNISGYEFRDDLSAWVSKGLVNETKETIDSEGFFSLDGRYTDFSFAMKSSVSRTTLTMRGPSTEKSVVFEGHSMVGILPRSSAALGNLVWAIHLNETELIDVSLNLSLEVPPYSTSGISVSVTNNEDFQVYCHNTVSPIWQVLVVRSNGWTAGFYPSMVNPASYSCSIESGLSFRLPGSFSLYTGDLPLGEYTLLISVPIGTTDRNGYPFLGLTTLSVEEAPEYANTPPYASFEVHPATTEADTMVLLDASGISDREDIVTDLEIRWDWNGDGEWDTDRSTDKTVWHRFSKSGKHTVYLEVADSGGLTNRSSAVVHVAGEEPLITLPVWLGIIVAVSALVVGLLFLLRHKRRQ